MTNRKFTRIDRILQAQARVKLALEQLEKLSSLDPRFADAINEYTDALENRGIVEKVQLS